MDRKIRAIIKEAKRRKTAKEKLNFLDLSIPWKTEMPFTRLADFARLIKYRNKLARRCGIIEKNYVMVDASQNPGKGLLFLRQAITTAFADIVESRDSFSGQHAKRSGKYAEAIARELKKENVFSDIITDDYLTGLSIAAPLHDIGKIVISDVIINKKGKLSKEEFEIMKTHTTEGKRLIEKILENLPEAKNLVLAAEIAYTHHERWDGTGYPRGLKGEEIPLCGRIVAVADVFDALISRRSYKEAYSFDFSVDLIMNESGTHFDPRIAEAFFNIKNQLKDMSSVE
jgi:HD-GYP domain-containing protein (c-di-GMP phosphodiesterase class II)